MSGKMIEDNRVNVIGEIVSGFILNHEVFGEGFYMMNVAINRLGKQADITPLMISEHLIGVHKDYPGCTMESIGQFRSCNRHEGVKSWLMLSIFVGEIHFIEESMDYTRISQIFLGGYIYEPPIYEKAPLGREIAGILLAMNRPCGKPDYIPCVSWGHSARFVSSFEVGTRVRAWGRVQNRKYAKKLSETECEGRIVYGVSISKPECDEA